MIYIMSRIAKILRIFFSRRRGHTRFKCDWSSDVCSSDLVFAPEPLPAPFIRNWTITQMRAQIQQGATWLHDFNWALRYCESAAEPFVISEMPLMAWGGQHDDLAEMLRHPETLLFFPLCWQACLIGSRQFFHEHTES